MKAAIVLAALLTALAVCPDHDYWVNRVWRELQQSVTCATCEILLGTLKAVAHQGPDVLRAVLTEMAPRPPKRPAWMCASLGRRCPWPEIDFNPTLPPEPSSKPITRSFNHIPIREKRSVRVAHLSDTHVDRFYTPGGPAISLLQTHVLPAVYSGRCAQQHALPLRGLGQSSLTSPASVEADYNTTYTALQTLNRQGPVYLALGNHDTSPSNIYPVSPTTTATTASSTTTSTARNSSAREAIGINYITPSLTSEHGRPAFRLYDVDPTTWTVVDYTVYVAGYDFRTVPPAHRFYGDSAEGTVLGCVGGGRSVT
ncbi:hypothetical protein BO82DRAFT_400535 [Aspergillus uvarum CBS 121591]|uniref:Calcineurin-like phosphoesterase domain-containing protein n=1 Tax=Aspergillus uvarum CBS 121591 TaxID=1448315 RepID=A0A319CJW4_9EURO|nr:hypothetical protein BO82DRAFT_400535 [Aspergillus uvarum CBS 121591]PYH83457.1 hypothetical protein BO82DRAFT_400535 [Aspergillus uvarum CBS 121591]